MLSAEVNGLTIREPSGDRVFAYCRKPEIRFGTYCEYVAVHESAVALMPRNVGFAEAATLPLAGLTAWQSRSVRPSLRSTSTA